MGKAVGGSVYAVEEGYIGIAKNPAPPAPVKDAAVPLESLEITGHMHPDKWKDLKRDLQSWFTNNNYPYVTVKLQKRPHK